MVGGVLTRARVLCVNGLEFGHFVSKALVVAEVSELNWSSKKSCAREYSW